MHNCTYVICHMTIVTDTVVWQWHAYICEMEEDAFVFAVAVAQSGHFAGDGVVAEHIVRHNVAGGDLEFDHRHSRTRRTHAHRVRQLRAHSVVDDRVVPHRRREDHLPEHKARVRRLLDLVHELHVHFRHHLYTNTRKITKILKIDI